MVSTRGKLIVSALILIGCGSQLPEPGTPEAERACASLRLTVAEVLRQYESSPDDWAFESFMLQAKEYKERLGCKRLPLGKYDGIKLE